jgi:ArsR family transcriptional regulator
MKYHILMPMTLDATQFYTALANEIRLRCLMLMQLEGELCVCELTHALDLSQPMMSRHLALLRNAGIVSDRRAGQWIYYQINSQLPEWAGAVLELTAQANRKRNPFNNDLQRLHGMSNRPDAACCG